MSNLPEELNLTLKQRKWIKEYIATGNATEAAMRVYDCKDRESAGSIGTENLQKLAMADLMEEMGLTDVALINAGASGMLAEKQTITGEKVPDYAVRHRYWETLLKVKGRLKENAQGNIFADKVIAILGGSSYVSTNDSNNQTS